MLYLWMNSKKESLIHNCRYAKELKKERIKIHNSGWKYAFYWNLVSYGRCSIYMVFDGEKLIHRSYVIGSGMKFPFLKTKDVEIGPCWTHENYRGQGIYPFVLGRILQDITSEKGSAYMIIDDENRSSEHGVMKAGFEKICPVSYSKLFKIYRKRF